MTEIILAPQSEQLLAERNQWLEQRLNPEGTLPPVMLEEIDLRDGMQSRFMKDYRAIDETGSTVGEVKLATPSPRASARGEKAHIQNIQANKGQGFGKAMYLEVLKSLPLETGMRSSDQLSRGSKPIWDWLVNAGVARQVGPNVVDEGAQNGGYSSTRYETEF